MAEGAKARTDRGDARPLAAWSLHTPDMTGYAAEINMQATGCDITEGNAGKRAVASIDCLRQTAVALLHSQDVDHNPHRRKGCVVSSCICTWQLRQLGSRASHCGSHRWSINAACCGPSVRTCHHDSVSFPPHPLAQCWSDMEKGKTHRMPHSRPSRTAHQGARHSGWILQTPRKWTLMPPATAEILQMMLCHPDLPCAAGPHLGREPTPDHFRSEHPLFCLLGACGTPSNVYAGKYT